MKFNFFRNWRIRPSHWNTNTIYDYPKVLYVKPETENRTEFRVVEDIKEFTTSSEIEISIYKLDKVVKLKFPPTMEDIEIINGKE